MTRPRPPYCHDVTERPIPRPTDQGIEHCFSSGKAKDYTVKKRYPITWSDVLAGVDPAVEAAIAGVLPAGAQRK